MELTMQDPMAQLLGLEVEQVGERGVTLRTELRSEFCNTYGFAHGGFVYTVGHITAAMSEKLCGQRSAVVVDASSQYLRSLTQGPVRAESELLRRGKEMSMYRVHVRDGRGNVCMEQIFTLKTVDYPAAPLQEFKQTIFPAGPETEPDPVLTIAVPKLSPGFATFCHVYTMGRGENGMIYSADLFPETCNLYGAAHGGLIYTCCDTVVGGSAAFLLEKKPVTVSSSVQYLRSITQGPVRAEASVTRAGRQLLYYNVDVTDGTGKLSAVAQFVLQTVDYAAPGRMDDFFQRKAEQRKEQN